MKRWIKVPGPGQFRGEGDWVEIAKTKAADEYFEWCKETGHLPTAEQEEEPTS